MVHFVITMIHAVLARHVHGFVGDRRRRTYLIAIYPSLMITLTPGYFWYLSLHPHGVGQV